MMKRAPRSLLFTLAALASLLAPSATADAPRPSLGGGRIGVQVQSMTPELRRHFSAPPDRGLLVGRVEPGGPADRAGVEVGDVLLEAGGVAQRRTWDLVRVVAPAAEGQRLSLRILRDGKARTLEVVPAGPAAPWLDPEEIGRWLERGMQLGSEELREQLRAIERRLEDLEKKMDRERERREGAERT